MAETLQGGGSNSAYGTGQNENRGTYGRSSFPEGGTAYEAYGNDRDRHVEYREEPYRESYGYEQRDNWASFADMGNIATLGIGAGLGFVAGYLLSGSGQRSRPTYQSYSNRQRSSGRSTQTRAVEKDETTELIASNKVEGTAVYDRQGKKLGEVYNFMVGKRSGRVAYAVMSFGGLMGVGSSHYPLPWSALDYDTSKGGYVVDLDKDRLNGAPSHGAGENGFSDPSYGRRVSEFWMVTA